MKNLTIIVSLFLCLEIEARNNVSINAQTPPARNLNTRVGDCIEGTEKVNLDINNVRAMLLNSGDMWWDRDRAKYGVPKLPIEQLTAGKRQVAPLFAGAIWISGKVSGNLQMAAMKYSSSSNQFFPGPIKQGQSSIDRQTCSKFDKFWSVTEEEIEKHKAGIATSDAILNWPGKGNPILVPDKYSDKEYTDESLAPFFDSDKNGIYNPREGDYPSIKSTDDPAAASVASQMVFWVINDVGGPHQAPDAAPIGIQMNCLAFAFATSDELNNMTFYTYEIHNKSNTTLEETIMSQFVDCDLGNFEDDYVGCDTVRSLGFCVNADPDDQTVTQAEGYGDRPPILAVDFFEGPRKVTGELIGLTSFIYFQLGAGAILSDPSTDIEHRNNQEGKIRNGQNFTVGGNCTGGTEPTKFCFPGNPNNPLPEWSMCSAGLKAGDYRFVQNSGPFDMLSGSSEIISVGVIFVQPPANSYQGCKIDFDRFLYPADEKAQRLFDFGFKNEKGPDAPNLKIFEANQRLDFSIENLTSSNNFGENYNKGDIDIPSVPGKIKDSTYKFEGYLIYQVKDPGLIGTFEDLQNPNNASLIKAMDLKNDVIQPKKYTEINGTYFPLDSIPFTNSGITKQFSLTEDRFQNQGQKFLINNKTYYFAAVAVAFNNYIDTIPKPNKRQAKQYKVSSRIPIFSASPHDEFFYGIRPKTKMGQTIDVTRVRGVGHGSYFLDISQKEEEKVIADNNPAVITYLGGRAPINVVVNDPYKIRNAEFKLKVLDSFTATTNLFPVSKTYWELEITDKDQNDTVITIASESNIDRGSEQSIFAEISSKVRPYGVSIALSTADSFDFAYRYNSMSRKPDSIKYYNNSIIYKSIGGEIKFEDSSKKWMTLLKDDPFADYTGWLRPGFKDEINLTGAARNVKQNSNFNFVQGKRVYTDSFGKFAKILDGSIAPYCLASNQYVTDATNDDNNYPAQGPGFKWRNLGSEINVVAANGEGPENNLDQLFSANIVFTNDKSKWSRCIVLETGDNELYNENGARKGQLRKAESLDINLQPAGDDTGRSYFPGYAINLETGERVNVYFGENSSKRGTYAANMIWDPNSSILTALGTPILGNGHYVYVTNTLYDEGDAHHKILSDNFNKLMPQSTSSSPILDTNVAKVYRDLVWTFIPIGDTGKLTKLYDTTGKYRIPNECRIKIRVEKPYGLYNDDGSVSSEYIFSTVGLAAMNNVASMMDSSFNNMRIVPNPYNAYSVYEQSSVQNTVKFIGVPKNSTITIVTTDGILVRKIKLGDVSTDNYLAANISNGEVNIDDAYSWDMRTTSGLLISSGVYYVHVNSPDKGEKVMKLFATMRSPDLSNF